MLKRLLWQERRKKQNGTKKRKGEVVATHVEVVASSVDGVGHLGACGAAVCRMRAGRGVWDERLRGLITDLQLRSRRISTRDQLSLKPPGHLLIRSVLQGGCTSRSG